jgi:beta-galactosidase/beta-glucuronidase
LAGPGSTRIPHPEDPRPQLGRPDRTNLNGEWSFAFDDDAGLERGWWSTPAGTLRSDDSPFDRGIIVPFCYQIGLSGIGDAPFHDVVWYARPFEPPPMADGNRLLIHFGAVDYRATLSGRARDRGGDGTQDHRVASGLDLPGRHDRAVDARL